MKNKILSILFGVITIVLSGCTGDKGDTGPTGPTGATGTTGATGNNGSANVTTTNFTVNPGDWSGSSPWWSKVLSVPAITDGSQDLVSVYVDAFNNGQWWALPISNLITASDNFQFSFSTGAVTLWYGNTFATTTSWNYKVVVVPPALARENDSMNWNNYSEVRERFNLPD